MGPFLKTALFTVVVPTSVAVLIPLFIGGERAAADGLVRVFAFLVLAVGALLYLRSAWNFASFGRGARPAYSLNKSEWVPVRTRCNSLPLTW